MGPHRAAGFLTWGCGVFDLGLRGFFICRLRKPRTYVREFFCTGLSTFRGENELIRAGATSPSAHLTAQDASFLSLPDGTMHGPIGGLARRLPHVSGLHWPVSLLRKSASRTNTRACALVKSGLARTDLIHPDQLEPDSFAMVVLAPMPHLEA